MKVRIETHEVRTIAERQRQLRIERTRREGLAKLRAALL